MSILLLALCVVSYLIFITGLKISFMEFILLIVSVTIAYYLSKDVWFRNVKISIRTILLIFPFTLLFLFQMAKANVDVAYRVISGKINPGIVKVKSCIKSEFINTILANSITLTPGTLTLDLKKNEMLIHMLNKQRVSKISDLTGKYVDMLKGMEK